MTRGFLAQPTSVFYPVGGAGAGCYRGPRGGLVQAAGAISGWFRLPRRHFSQGIYIQSADCLLA